VVCKEDGAPYDSDYISRNYRRILKDYKVCEKLKIPYIRFHDLRHTYATLLLTADVNNKVMTELMVHSCKYDAKYLQPRITFAKRKCYF